jgi:hypothetical protein
MIPRSLQGAERSAWQDAILPAGRSPDFLELLGRCWVVTFTFQGGQLGRDPKPAVVLIELFPPSRRGGEREDQTALTRRSQSPTSRSQSVRPRPWCATTKRRAGGFSSQNWTPWPERRSRISQPTALVRKMRSSPCRPRPSYGPAVRATGKSRRVGRRPGSTPQPTALPRRCIRARRLTAHRRLARDYETSPAHTETMIRWAMIGVVVRRLTRGRPATRPGPRSLSRAEACGLNRRVTQGSPLTS